MKFFMMTHLKNLFNLNEKKIVLILVGWLILCLLFYVFIHIWEGNRRNALIKTGITISKDISSQSGLLLLERDINRLSGLIENIKEKPDVVFASIIDHKHKIIAYTDQAQFSNLNRQKSGFLDDVYYWRVTHPNNQRGMTFSSVVTFSDTKVGEVLISLSADDIGRLQNIFFLFAGSSLLVLVLLFGTIKYKAFRSGKQSAIKPPEPQKTPVTHDLMNPEFFCPLCGQSEIFSQNRFRPPELGNFSILTRYPGPSSSVFISDLSRVEELNWLKRLMVAQCTKIINKLAAE